MIRRGVAQGRALREIQSLTSAMARHGPGPWVQGFHKFGVSGLGLGSQLGASGLRQVCWSFLGVRVFIRCTPHPVIVTIRDNRDDIRDLIYSYYTTITGWGVLLSYLFV